MTHERYETSDWRLVARAQAGDQQAFTELVQRYQRPVLHFCRRMVTSHEEAEDIAQDCFVRLYRVLPRLREEAQFSTFLFGIARNLTLNALRDAKRRGRHKAASLDERPLAADPLSRPERQVRVHEIESTLEAALAALTPEHRAVLLLREVQGLDYDAIASVLGCRKGTVRSRLARAREQLRVRLIELGGDEL